MARLLSELGSVAPRVYDSVRLEGSRCRRKVVLRSALAAFRAWSRPFAPCLVTFDRFRAACGAAGVRFGRIPEEQWLDAFPQEATSAYPTPSSAFKGREQPHKRQCRRVDSGTVSVSERTVSTVTTKLYPIVTSADVGTEAGVASSAIGQMQPRWRSVVESDTKIAKATVDWMSK